jgi:hypothetical protein
MFVARRKSTGVNHTMKVTCLIAAFIFSTAVLAASRSRSPQSIGTVE